MKERMNSNSLKGPSQCDKVVKPPKTEQKQKGDAKLIPNERKCRKNP